MENNWLGRFEKRSQSVCSEFLDKATREDVGMALAQKARVALARFEASGLWHQTDRISFSRWGSLGPRLRVEAAGVESMALESLNPIAEDKALKLWRSGARVEAIDLLWFEIEPQIFPLFKERALSLDDEAKARSLLALSGRSGELEDRLVKAMRKSLPQSQEPRCYEAQLMAFFHQRMSELSKAGLLPAAKGFTLVFLPKAPLPRMDPVDYGSSPHPSGPRIRCRLEAHPTTPVAGRWHYEETRSEFEYEPRAGWGGMFKMGGWIHSAILKRRGALYCMENDWARFEQSLIDSHAWMLAKARSNGSSQAWSIAERCELVTQSQLSPWAPKSQAKRL